MFIKSKIRNLSAIAQRATADPKSALADSSPDYCLVSTDYCVNPFTLIELLVVIAIISVLASMLMPELSKARDKAKAIYCLALRKQLYIPFVEFSKDFKGKVPRGARYDTAKGGWYLYDWGAGDKSNYRFTSTSFWYYAHSYQMGDHDHRNNLGRSDIPLTYGMGVLAASGYAKDVNLWHCSGYKDMDPNSFWYKYKNVNEPQNLQYWKEFADNDDVIQSISVSVSHFLGPDPFPRHNSLDYIASNWKEIWCSPLLFSCSFHRNTIDSPGRYIAPHNMKGVAGIYYDGSGRWITAEEAARGGAVITTVGSILQHSLSNAGTDTAWDKRMTNWARRYATPSGTE